MSGYLMLNPCHKAENHKKALCNIQRRSVNVAATTKMTNSPPSHSDETRYVVLMILPVDMRFELRPDITLSNSRIM